MTEPVQPRGAEMVEVRWAKGVDDLDFLHESEHELARERIAQKMAAREILIILVDGQPVGWLRFGYFWDTVPMMNMLVLLESYRRQGLGRKLVEFWERAMASQGYAQVMTSTQVDEAAQFFYRRLGYRDCGSFLAPDQILAELILWKELENLGQEESSCS